MTSAHANSYPDPGDVPVLDWVPVDTIDADPLYQRPLDTKRVGEIAKAFTWRSFGALVVVAAGDGRYHIADGQHRLAAAKVHPSVTHVPAVVVKAEGVQAEAGVFVAVNRDRKNVSALELFFAALAAGDENAVAALKLCTEAGLRIPKSPSNFRPNDTVAVMQIGALVNGYIASRALEFLKVVAAGNFAPVTAAQLRAVEHILTTSEFKDHVTGDDLAALLASAGRTLDGEAKRFSATHNVPFWKGLANIWFQKVKKRKAKPQTAAPARLASVAATVVRVDGRSITGRTLGDPEPGRSALDQRRAAG